MTLEEFFDEYDLQLMYAPMESVTALDRAVATGDVAAGAERIAADDSVYVGSFFGLRTEYAPPADAVCLGFHDEPGQSDVVRCRYRVGLWTLDYARTSQMKCLRIACPDMPGDPFDLAKAVAARIFEPKWNVVPMLAGAHRGVVFGGQDNERTGFYWGEDPQWGRLYEHWRDELKWWHEDHAVGFVSFVGYLGGRQVMGRAGLRSWFSGEDEEEP